ncbi:MAG TPA: fibronectin type III-like domain-contianing protein [Flavisolibacter sp.]|jgi:beta-glucosidase|nr:fibronectin type III-like domain-contianing protein [Flavisolibacter sp.]
MGKTDGDEVAQVYLQYPAVDRMPLKELKTFQRLTVQSGGKQTIQFAIPLHELQKWDAAQRKWKLYPGSYTILVGSSSQDIRLQSAVTIKSALT